MTILRRIGSYALRRSDKDVEFFGSIGATATSVYLPLARAAASSENPYQDQAIWHLGFYKYRRAVPLLIRIAQEHDALYPSDCDRRLAGVCDALGMLDDPRAHRELVRLYDESKRLWTRADAIDALGYEKRCAEPERLIQVLDSDEEGPIRMSAIWAMYEQVTWYTFQPYESAILAAITDREPMVRGLAAETLGRTRRTEFRPLIESLLTDKAPCRYMNVLVADLARTGIEMLDE